MKPKFAILLTLIALIISCKKDVKQFEFSGNTFKMCLENGPLTKYTFDIEDYYSSTVYSQVMQGLTAIDPKSLKIIPGLAKSWTLNEDGTVYTFVLRDDVLFHPSEELAANQRNLNTTDVIETFKLICKRDKNGKNTF